MMVPPLDAVCTDAKAMLNDLSLFAMVQKKMDWLTRRQEVLSENIANANTPKYQPRDLKPLDFGKMMADEQPPAVQAVATSPMHIVPPTEDDGKFRTQKEHRPEESKPDGNAVLIEEQMKKIGDVKNAYDLAANLYQKNLSMIKTAIGKNGGS